MAVEQDDRQKITEDVPSGIDRLFHEHRRKRENAGFRKAMPRLFSTAIAVAICLIVIVYFMSPMSRIKTIAVSGNYYLKQSYIEQLSDLSLDSRFFLTNPLDVAAKIKKDGLIEDCKVDMLDSNVVRITVTEKKVVGYRYDTDPVLLLADGSTTALTSDYLSIIAKVPLITGFDDDSMLHLLCKAFSSVDQNIIEEIAEVSQYQMEYDDQALKILMQDGGYVIASYYSLQLLNDYNELSSRMSDRSKCLYADEGLKVAYVTTCPWNQTTQTYEYWLDDNGNPVVNKYGDKAVKHYYQDAEGNYYLDQSGNWIAIPIGTDGLDNEDLLFKEHYDAGYYATGTLVIPADSQTG